LPSVSASKVGATVIRTGTTISSSASLSTMAPSYIPYGVSAGTVTLAVNDPEALAGVVIQPQSTFS